MLIVTLVLQLIGLYIVTYIYRDGIGGDNTMYTYIISFFLVLGTIFAFWGIYVILWLFCSDKSLELNPTDIVYSQKLFNKVKTDSYKWEDIETFTSDLIKKNHFLVLKNKKGKTKTLFQNMKMDEIEVQRLLFKINGYIKITHP